MGTIKALAARGVAACVRSASRMAVCAVLWLAPTGPAHAQPSHPLVPLSEMQHTAWSYADSIMLGGTTQIVASNDGYLWLSSTRGLIRFDGIRFTLIDSSATPALRTTRAGLFVPQMLQHDGTMWITRPDNALVTYRDGQFRVRAPATIGRSIATAEQGTDHVIVYPVGDTFLRELHGDGGLDTIALPFALPTMIRNVIRDSADGLWVGTQPAALWHHTHGVWSKLEIPADIKMGGAVVLLHAHDGSLWVSIGGLLRRFQHGQWQTINPPDQPDAPIQAEQIQEDAQGAIWIATSNYGLLRWHDARIESFGLKDGLSGTDGISVYVSPAGVAWIGTGAGLDRLRVTALHTVTDDDAIPLSSTSRIVQDAQGIGWAESDASRTLVRLSGGFIANSLAPLVVRPVAVPSAPGSGYQLLSAARTGGAWVAPYSGGIAKISNAGFQLIASSDQLHSARVWTVLETRSGVLWFARLFGGVGRIENGTYSALDISGLDTSRIAAFAEDSAGHVWISLDREPRVVEVAGSRIVQQLGPASGVRDTVLRLVADRGDTLWGIGTNSIVRIIGKNATTVAVPTIARVRGFASRVRGQGVPSLSAFIARERLWVVGEGGITQFPLAQLHQAFDHPGTTVNGEIMNALDGVSTPSARAMTIEPVSRSNDGRYWIRTPTGFITLFPDRLNAGASTAHPIIEEITADGHNASGGDHAVGPHVERVDIRVTATTDEFPERVQLEHQLVGVESRWSPTPSSRIVSYSQLPPGHYTFRLRVRGSQVTDISEATSLNFDVVPAWYQTIWFRAVVLLLLLAGGPSAVYAIVRSRSRVREAQLQARFDAALEERTRVARELHDTLLQGFSGIALQLQAALLSNTESPEDTAERLSRTLTLVDATLLDARRSIWDMRMPELASHDLASALEASARTAVADTTIAVVACVRGRRRRLAPVLESTALRIGREAVTNAVRHARPSTIEIDLVYGDSSIELFVRDNGDGFIAEHVDAAAQHGHFGVSGMRERASSVGAYFDMSEQPGGGTAVSLRIPFDSAHAITSGANPTREVS